MAIGSKGIGFGGISFPSGGGGSTPVPIIKTMTFGRKSATIVGADQDTFNGIYMLKNSDTVSIADGPAYFRAGANDVFQKATVGCGGTASASVIVSLYSSAALLGPWTKVAEIKQTVTTTGSNVLVDFVPGSPVTLTQYMYYFLSVASPTVEIVQYPVTGGSEKWTYADPNTTPLTDAAGSTSNYATELYGTIQRTTNP